VSALSVWIKHSAHILGGSSSMLEILETIVNSVSIFLYVYLYTIKHASPSKIIVFWSLMTQEVEKVKCISEKQKVTLDVCRQSNWTFVTKNNVTRFTIYRFTDLLTSTPNKKRCMTHSCTLQIRPHSLSGIKPQSASLNWVGHRLHLAPAPEDLRWFELWSFSFSRQTDCEADSSYDFVLLDHFYNGTCTLWTVGACSGVWLSVKFGYSSHGEQA
jgi:hypothetical protein